MLMQSRGQFCTAGDFPKLMFFNKASLPGHFELHRISGILEGYLDLPRHTARNRDSLEKTTSTLGSRFPKARLTKGAVTGDKKYFGLNFAN